MSAAIKYWRVYTTGGIFDGSINDLDFQETIENMPRDTFIKIKSINELSLYINTNNIVAIETSEYEFPKKE